MSTKQIYNLLIRIGASPSYNGYYYLAYIIGQIMQQSDGPSPFLVKSFYKNAAQYFLVTPDSVQQGIRTLLNAYWAQGNGQYFRQVTGYSHPEPLSPKEFIAVLVDYMQRHSS